MNGEFNGSMDTIPKTWLNMLFYNNVIRLKNLP
ncbi:hypothetical protein J2T25_001244 [Citrobacter amalonaticus]|jgi:hypothetical protein|nr:hypothetical protein [Citrobacter amalonaticus]